MVPDWEAARYSLFVSRLTANMIAWDKYAPVYYNYGKRVLTHLPPFSIAYGRLCRGEDEVMVIIIIIFTNYIQDELKIVPLVTPYANVITKIWTTIFAIIL